MAILRIGWNGERRNKAFSAEKRYIDPPLEMTMNVFLSRQQGSMSQIGVLASSCGNSPYLLGRSFPLQDTNQNGFPRCRISNFNTLLQFRIGLNLLIIIIVRILLIKLAGASRVAKLLKILSIAQCQVSKTDLVTAMFLARLSAFFLAANFFSVILFSMTASSSLVKGRKVGRLLSESFSAWFSDMVVGLTSSGSGSRYHLKIGILVKNLSCMTLLQQ